MTISGHSFDEALALTAPGQMQSWQARFLAAIHSRLVPGCGHLKLLLIYLAATNYVSPAEKATGKKLVPHFGANALIKADRTLHTVLTDRHGVDHADWTVCTVDDLLRALGWVMDAIDATDAEYGDIVNTVSRWISRDETQLFKDVERKREEIERARDVDLSGIEKELEEKGKL